MQQWKRVEPTVVTKVGWRTIVSKTFEMPDGRIATFDTIASEDSRCAATIALTPDNNVIIARQFRSGPEQIFEELPGGAVEPGEHIEVDLISIDKLLENARQGRMSDVMAVFLAYDKLIQLQQKQSARKRLVAT